MTVDMVTVWVCIGLLGQVVFGSRFVFQWLYSEKHKKSMIPDIFWYISIVGGLILLAYAIHKKDPVFIIGQGMGLFVYLRNLYFIIQARKKIPLNESEYAG